MSTRTNTEPAL